MISPSSYKLYRRCPRAWWYRYVDKRRPEGGPWLALGTAVHEAAEAVLRGEGVPPTAAPEVQSRLRPDAVSILDTLRAIPGGRIEVAIDRQLPGAEDRLGGRVDWTHPTGGRIGDQHVPLVVDHKTTKDPQWWATPDSLAADPQLLAYAWALYPEWAGPIVVAHLYLPPLPHVATLVEAVATAEARSANARGFAEVSRITAELRRVQDAEAVPATPGGACRQFGGCDHREVCSACPAWAKPRAPRAPQPTTPAQEVPVTPAQRRQQNEVRKRSGLPPLPEIPEGGAPTEAPAGGSSALQEATNRDAPTQDTPAPATAPQEAQAAPERALPTMPPESAEDTADAPTEIRVAPVAQSPATTAGERKPRKSRKVADPASAEIVRGGALPDPLVLVGCVASTGEGATVESWAGEYLEQAATGLGVPSYLVAEFGKGPPTAAALIVAAVRRGELGLPPVLTIPGRHPLAPYLAPGLRALGAVVVVGVSA